VRAALPAVLLAALLVVACGGGDDGGVSRVTVRAEVVEADAPASVDVSAVSENDRGEFEHEVRVTWNGAQTARLADARFAHHVESDGGSLVTLGRGCGASQDEASDELFIACTADLQLILVQPGETHVYTVRVPREVGDVRLRRGTYVVEEPIHWWQQATIEAEPTAEGEFTVRLTYEVE
jgi:hypothetical protein